LNNPMGCTDPTGFEDVQQVEIIGSRAPEVPTAPVVAGNGGATGAAEANSGKGSSKTRLSVRTAILGSNIMLHTDTAEGQAVSNAGASGVVERGSVVLPDGKTLALADLVAEFGSIQNV